MVLIVSNGSPVAVVIDQVSEVSIKAGTTSKTAHGSQGHLQVRVKSKTTAGNLSVHRTRLANLRLLTGYVSPSLVPIIGLTKFVQCCMNTQENRGQRLRATVEGSGRPTEMRNVGREDAY